MRSELGDEKNKIANKEIKYFYRHSLNLAINRLQLDDHTKNINY